MNLLPTSHASLQRLFQATAVVGVLAGLLGLVVGWGLLTQARVALEDSLTLTADTLAALDATAGVAADSVEALSVSLASLETTAESLDQAFEEGEVLLEDLADVVRGDVAGSLRAVDDALPGLISVAGTIDATLSTLSRLPLGPTYDPSQSFQSSLRALDGSLDGLPDRLVEQADQVDQASRAIGDVGQGVAELVLVLGTFDATLADTTELLDTYEQTIGDGRLLVEQAADRLGTQFALGRVALVLLVVAFLMLQAVPLHLAATLAPDPSPPA